MPDLLDKAWPSSRARGESARRPSQWRSACGRAQGKRTIVCEVAAQEHASHAFHRGQVGFHEVALKPNLWAISIDPDHSMREYVLLQLKVPGDARPALQEPHLQLPGRGHPGSRELVTIGKIWELAQLDRKTKKGQKYDLVIVDAPATGHGIGFLQTPRTFANIARVGPIRSQAERLDTLHHRPRADRDRRSSRCPRRCRSTRRRSSRPACATRSALPSTACS